MPVREGLQVCPRSTPLGEQGKFPRGNKQGVPVRKGFGGCACAVSTSLGELCTHAVRNNPRVCVCLIFSISLHAARRAMAAACRYPSGQRRFSNTPLYDQNLPRTTEGYTGATISPFPNLRQNTGSDPVVRKNCQNCADKNCCSYLSEAQTSRLYIHNGLGPAQPMSPSASSMPITACP